MSGSSTASSYNATQIALAHQEARLQAKPLSQWSETLKDLNPEFAYQCLWEGIKLRLAANEKLIAYKMGLTSEAKRKQMNLDSPLYGVLTDKMLIGPDQAFSLKGSIHPKIEPEIAFKISKPITKAISLQEASDYIDSLAPALEILDSRYSQFKYFSLEDVIIDNSSSSHYCLGEFISCHSDAGKNLLASLADCSLVFKYDDQELTGNLKAINGNPLISLVQLSELLDLEARPIEAGAVVLAGAATTAIKLESSRSSSVSLEVAGFAPLKLDIRA